MLLEMKGQPPKRTMHLYVNAIMAVKLIAAFHLWRLLWQCSRCCKYCSHSWCAVVWLFLSLSHANQYTHTHTHSPDKRTRKEKSHFHTNKQTNKQSTHRHTTTKDCNASCKQKTENTPQRITNNVIRILAICMHAPAEFQRTRKINCDLC